MVRELRIRELRNMVKESRCVQKRGDGSIGFAGVVEGTPGWVGWREEDGQLVVWNSRSRLGGKSAR